MDSRFSGRFPPTEALSRTRSVSGLGGALKGSTHHRTMTLIISGGACAGLRVITRSQDEVWQRWRSGESLSSIARGVGAPLQHVRRFFAQTGGVRPPAVRGSLRHLAVAEREEVSRGLAAGHSARAIARRLGRSAATVSREIARNGGREHYRARNAEDNARRRACRPKPAKLAQHLHLRGLVEDKLARRWSPQQIVGWLRRRFPQARHLRVSHETSYRSLFDPRRRAINRDLSRQLRTGRPMR